MSVALQVYRFAAWIGLPAIEVLLRRRVNRGREEAARLDERRGKASMSRPAGELIWIHAASVGEANSCLRVIEMLLKKDDVRTVLLTTGTVTSANVVRDRLPTRAIHQYYPVDRGAWVSRFLDHWKPDAAVWVESELWPNMIMGAARRNIPLALINGRMSGKSERNWNYAGAAIRELLGCFSVCLAQTPADAECLNRLGARDAVCVGNLKYSAVPPAAPEAEVSAMERAINKRPIWLAASTHPGDEEIALEAHRRLKQQHPEILTFIALRHPDRLDEVVGSLAKGDLSISWRSRDKVPATDTSVFIIDTVGEMGLFYRLSSIVLVCGSFSDRGGHNPIEPAMLGTAILHGPDMRNFATVAEDLRLASGAIQVESATEVADRVSALLANPEKQHALATAARHVADVNNGVIDRVMERINAMMQDDGHA